MKQRVFGSHRTIGSQFLKAAGAAAKVSSRFILTIPRTPIRSGSTFRLATKHASTRYPTTSRHSPTTPCRFCSRRSARRTEPRPYSRRPHRTEKYQGVTGEIIFDPNCKNIHPLYLASVHNGTISYHEITMEKAYARVGEDGVQYSGPKLPDQASELRNSPSLARRPTNWCARPRSPRCWKN